MDKTDHLKIKNISAQLLVSDMERSIGFYKNQLDFDVSFRYEDFYAGITNNGFSIHLKLGNTSIEERNNRRDNQHLDLTFSVEAIDSLYKEVVSRSVIIIQPLRDMPYGKEFYIADPDGYIIGFIEEGEG